MKKYLYITIASLIAFVACDKEARVQEEVPGNEPVAEKLVSITASIPSEGLNTKVSITEADNGAGKMRLTKLSWEEGDEITVNSKTFTVKTGSISGDGLTATFQGEDPGAGPYNITYTNVPGDLNNQLQPADGDPSEVGYSVSLTGADTFEGATFSSAWASSHGATFAQSSVLQLRALLPAAVAAGVKKVIFKSTANIFNGSNTLTVTLTSAGTTGTDNKLDVYAMLPAGDITLAADMDLLVQFEMDGGNEYDKYTAFRHFASGTIFVQSGYTKYMGLDCSNIAMHAGPSTCDGSTAVKAFLIGDQHQMQAISLTTTKQYYKLVDDIDMTSVSWTSLNAEGTKIIDLNGNNKKISNMRAPLFADLNGNIYNLTLYNSVVSSAETVGILANTCNTAASTVSGVTVAGDAPSGEPLTYHSTLTSTATASKKYVGGLVGEVSTLSTFDGCHVINTLVSSPVGDYTYTGGGFGYVHVSNYSCIIQNCTVESSLIYSDSYTGGLVGYQNRGRFQNNKVGYDADNNEKKCIVAGPNGAVSGNYKGGLSGVFQYGYEENNKVLCDVSGASYLGGFSGRMRAGVAQNNVNAGTITAVSTYVGGFAGSIESASPSSNNSSANVIGSVKESQYLGGFAGQITGGTTNSNTASGSVTSAGGQSADYGCNGGFAGQITGGTVTNNSSSGDINTNGAYLNGGFVGKVSGGTIIGNSASGDVDASSGGFKNGGFAGILTNVVKFEKNCASGNTDGYKFYDGGLIGFIDAGENAITIESCYASGYAKVPKGTSNSAHVGGLIGRIESGTVTINNCYSTGAVEAYRYSGCFIGSINVAITVNNCYTNSAADFNKPDLCAVFIGNAGAKDNIYSGIIACNTSSLTNFIYNTTVTVSTPVPDGNYFGTTDDINTQATALGWDSILDGSSKAVWDLTWGDNRPHLAWEPKP
jgi:hypothetical protein